MNVDKLFDYIIKVLIAVLIIIIIINIYTYINYKKKYVPNNSINVSPITGEIITNVYNRDTLPISVNYTDIYENNSICGLGKADIIYEYIDENQKLNYNAIFYSNIPNNNYPISSIRTSKLDSIPSFNFKDGVDVDSNLINAEYLFINLNNLYTSNFIYKDGVYEHFLGSLPHVDSLDKEIIKATNVIVQFVDDPISFKSSDKNDSGHGMLFSSGKALNMKWVKDDNKTSIYDANEVPLSIVRGNTWWVIIDKSNSLIYK
ncbi:DUF3048 C-terminal domain-containing protein [Clostridium algidicarnis]|uniref:DUF3048 C-terminal domain-containing protein n=1 Tax=Clostridium algidicarnis TaxID=37659 RepID=UPI001C0AE8A7|nr:DUF3048 C-terminal domain-containing protein [Clostridium algidicarnis]MBU3196809.1 DUF3048 C-terminal domain-containing protein [Clostridium algidicarnis]MBU3227878.1 DUF3048 C-terminal domain-containing protein [Clostridium algidicarnis]MBU3251628.1 DUF3048 C-terminal domain-containing protein [Clostridium algidicarnis]